MEFMTHVVLDYSIDCTYMCMYIYICVCICTHFDRKKKEFPRELKLIRVVVISR